MKFDELKKGNIYTDKDGVNAYEFVGIRNESIATFKACIYSEEKGDYITTEEIRYLTANEVSKLI